MKNDYNIRNAKSVARDCAMSVKMECVEYYVVEARNKGAFKM